MKRSLLAALLACIVSPAALGQTASYQVVFNVNTTLNNVFVYADEWNGEVYAWDLFPIALGTVGPGTTTFNLGSHNVVSWAVISSSSGSGVGMGINDSLGTPPDGRQFSAVFPGYDQATVRSNITTLYVNGAYNTQQAYFLTEFVLACEDTLKTDRPSGVVTAYTFSPGAAHGTATFGIAPPPPPACPADFNNDGVLNADDLADFITGYFNQPPNPATDFNGDAVINADDLGDFITAYFNGC